MLLALFAWELQAFILESAREMAAMWDPCPAGTRPGSAVLFASWAGDPDVWGLSCGAPSLSRKLGEEGLIAGMTNVHTYPVAGLQWDAANWPKCGKHGLRREEIEDVFKRAPAIYPDPGHSLSETRFLAIGTTSRGRYVFVAFTLRLGEGRRWIRPISARYMHAKEVRHYEQRRQRE